jgi:hypothetical protein
MLQRPRVTPFQTDSSESFFHPLFPLHFRGKLTRTDSKARLIVNGRFATLVLERIVGRFLRLAWYSYCKTCRHVCGCKERNINEAPSVLNGTYCSDGSFGAPSVRRDVLLSLLVDMFAQPPISKNRWILDGNCNRKSDETARAAELALVYEMHLLAMLT